MKILKFIQKERDKWFYYNKYLDKNNTKIHQVRLQFNPQDHTLKINIDLQDILNMNDGDAIEINK